MKKKLVGIFVLMLLISTGISSVSGSELDHYTSISTLNVGNTLYVGGSGPGNYSTIQEAIDNASYMDTIFVYSGIYYEHVKIYTSVILIGEDKESTIIDAGGSGDVICVTADNVKIAGFSIINSGSYWLEAGIELNRIEHCIITDNIISNCGFGIAPFITTDVTISINTIKDNDFGISAHVTSYSNITKNSIVNNRRGIYLNEVSFSKISKNNFIDNERHLSFYGVFRNKINDNYWERFLNIGPKLIIGALFLLVPMPGFIIDWHPVEEPYDI